MLSWHSIEVICCLKHFSFKQETWEQSGDCHNACVFAFFSFAFLSVLFNSNEKAENVLLKAGKPKPCDASAGVSGTRMEKHCYK